MRLSKSRAALLILIVMVLSLSGCSTLVKAPVAILGGAFKLVGGALSLARKLPWWMWI